MLRLVGNGSPVPSVTADDVAEFLGPPNYRNRVMSAVDSAMVSRGPDFYRAHYLPTTRRLAPIRGGKRRGNMIMDAQGTEAVLSWMRDHKTACPSAVYEHARVEFANAFSAMRTKDAPLVTGIPEAQTAQLPVEDRPAQAGRETPESPSPQSPRLAEAMELSAVLQRLGASERDATVASLEIVYGLRKGDLSGLFGDRQ